MRPVTPRGEKLQSCFLGCCSGLPTANLPTSIQACRLLAAGAGGARWDAGSWMGHSVLGGTRGAGWDTGCRAGAERCGAPSQGWFAGCRGAGRAQPAGVAVECCPVPFPAASGVECAGKGWCPRAVPPRHGSGASGTSLTPGPGVPALCRAPALCWARGVRSGTPSARPPASSPGVKVPSSGSGYFPRSSGRKLSSRCRPS